jgi:hypothetical protein
LLWAFPKLTVMSQRPMQMNWRGKFSETPEVKMPFTVAGAILKMRRILG